jgi:hypothetical protein
VDLQTTIIGIVVGGIATWFIQHAIQRSSQKRQLLLDISKHKFETIQKSSGDYVALTSALGRFHELSLKSNESNEEKFYAICNFCKAYWQFSGFELDSLGGEDAMDKLSREILSILDNLGDETVSNMIKLLESEKEERIRFPEFKKKLPTPLFNNFCKKILADPHISKKLDKYCEWLREVILFELNTAYSLWYGENPKFDLTDGFMNYLEENNLKAYAKKLEVTKKSKIKRELFKLQHWISN